jgi:hypothetical protein
MKEKMRKKLEGLAYKIEDVGLAGAGLSYLSYTQGVNPIFVPVAFLGTYAGTELLRREMLKRKLRKMV